VNLGTIRAFTTKRASYNRPFFLVVCFLYRNFSAGSDVALKDIVEQTVTGLGFDLVDIEHSAGGLLRVTIDWPWAASQSLASVDSAVEQFITVEDCEKVTRQLQFALEVEAIEYRRLEVSSPGIDRPLRHAQDFDRFVGQVVDVTLKAPLGAQAGGLVHANRKKFRGQLERVEPMASQESAPRWQIVWRDEPTVKPGVRVSKKRVPAPLQVLAFQLDELKEARLAPIVNFKGRGHPNTSDVAQDLN